ncbi:multiprotein bridging factor aMBF1 [Halodesulfurarchaeum sp. HSR-GB]|uniref:XRE family transcriptional regulator n=1 Tax=Halodesulfurarchaeum formicicum TaxID=1873524 RepID=A0A1J1ABX6_9EURY|nr:MULTISPECIES: multiprotein bridging factor aMBF1 [Halodesulfurarchaeum]APE95381.1 XRE family transcriptional regulator [Halodesulfurarchaeum formicicum]MDR5657333.1 multiprotein bridging factor aMBF1 [Halodesulfurarchaeum sp. HSR-GB]
MVQCEMCGAETASPKTVKIEGAELQVCADCAEFGTEVTTQDAGSTSTKYSTSSTGKSGSSSGGSTSSGRSGGRRRDLYDEMEELAEDYDTRIRKAREGADLTQEELANEINEKVSLIRKIEHGDILPSDDVQSKLEGYLGIVLTAAAEASDEDWDSGGADSGLTLGDMVERKD